MHNQHILALSRTADNPDFRRFCKMLSVLQVGDAIPSPEDIALLVGIEPTMAAWFIDTLVEASCLIEPEPEPFRVAA